MANLDLKKIRRAILGPTRQEIMDESLQQWKSLEESTKAQILQDALTREPMKYSGLPDDIFMISEETTSGKLYGLSWTLDHAIWCYMSTEYDYGMTNNYFNLLELSMSDDLEVIVGGPVISRRENVRRILNVNYLEFPEYDKVAFKRFPS